MKPLAVIREVCALKPKMYSILTKTLKCSKISDDGHVCDSGCQYGHSATAKGVSAVSKRKTTHEDYKSVLLNSGTTSTSSNAIRALNNSMYSVKIRKRGLSAYDDKKYILKNKINTLSYGHYRLL